MPFSATKGYVVKPKPGARINPVHPLSQGLVGHWLFNEGAGSHVNDISGHGNHGTMMDMSPNTPGSGWCGSKFGGSLGFDGVDDGVESIKKVGIDGASPRTMSLWIKAGAKQTAYYGQVLIVWGDCNTGKSSVILYDPYHYTDEGFKLSSWGGSANELNSSANIVTRGKWQHIVATYDGTEACLYINGEFDVSGAMDMDTLNGPARIGHVLACDAYGQNFEGLINCVSVYNRALSAAKIEQLYHHPFGNLLRAPIRYAPAAAGGLSIPVAMYHYRQQRIS